MNLNLRLNNITKYIDEEAINLAEDKYQELIKGSGKGNNYLGWLNLANDSMDFVDDINSTAKRIQKDSDCLIVIGIGGSYLGAKAALDFLRTPNYNLVNKDTPNIYFVGNNMSTDYINEIIDLISDKDFSINVISKSGTTLEPAISYRIFKELLIKKYKDKYVDRIYVTTDNDTGILRSQAEVEGLKTFVIPDNVGGRYSVLSPVGLLPLSVAGINIKKLLESASNFMDSKEGINLSKTYASIRYIAHLNGVSIELLSAFSPKLNSISEWWKQLYGESEGKEHKGLFPVSLSFTTDLHSLGQYIQDGKRLFIETFINVTNENTSIVIKEDPENLDRLNYLSGKNLVFCNLKALEGTELAHKDGGVPNMRLELLNYKEETLGELISFFELACGISGYMIDVNPFDQPGVEEYKKNMFKLLGK